MKRKIVNVVLCVCLIAALVGALAACNKKDKNKGIYTSSPTASIVFLGDSIAEGILGPTPISMREEFCYYSLIGQRNNFKYYNYSVSGYKTDDLLEYVKQEDTDARMIKTRLMEANIIHISILGNDVLRAMHLNHMFEEYLEGRFTTFDEYTADTYANITGIVQTLKALNPTATIVFQTIYAPVYDGSPLINEENWELIRSEYSMDEMFEIAVTLMDKLHAFLYRYLEEYGPDFQILDICAASQEMYRETTQEGALYEYTDYIYPDGIHPTNLLHAKMADCFQEFLENDEKTKKLIDTNKALAYHKEMRSSSLDLYYGYAGSGVDVQAVKAAISASTTHKAVTDAFFGAVNKVIPDYARGVKRDYGKRNIDKSVVGKYYFDAYSSLGGGNVMGTPAITGGMISIFLDVQQSYIELKSDGTIIFQLTTIDNLDMDKISSLLGTLGMSVDDMLGEDLDLSSGVDTYVKNLFPGFDLSDVAAGLNLLKGSMGVEIIGLNDPSDPTTQLWYSALASGKLPDPLVLPRQLAIRYTGTYFTEKVTSSVTGQSYTAVYFGNPHPNGNPFITATQDYDQATKLYRLYFNIDVVGLYALFTYDPVPAA